MTKANDYLLYSGIAERKARLLEEAWESVGVESFRHYFGSLRTAIPWRGYTLNILYELQMLSS